MSDYIKREDAIKAMAQYLMDMALIDNPEASDRIEQWEGNIAAPVMSTVKAADARENVKGEWIYTPVENGMIIAMCSICKKVSAITPSVKEWYRFCPNCGADMRGEA